MSKVVLRDYVRQGRTRLRHYRGHPSEDLDAEGTW